MGYNIDWIFSSDEINSSKFILSIDSNGASVDGFAFHGPRRETLTVFKSILFLLFLSFLYVLLEHYPPYHLGNYVYTSNEDEQPGSVAPVAAGEGIPSLCPLSAYKSLC